MNSWHLTTLAILCGCGMDLLLGDPHWFYHPVRLIGLLITGLEKVLWSVFPKTKTGERIAGVLLVILVLAATGCVSAGILRLAVLADQKLFEGTRAGNVGDGAIHFLMEVLMSCSLLAARSLSDESMKVCGKLEKGDLPGARKAVSMIVGRDTENLTEEGVAKAAVETVAENTSDGVIAPLFYLAVGGPVLGWLYKAANTMDSMVGYRNDRYRYFGTAAARLDDVLNFIPARLSGLAIVLCARWAGLDRGNAWEIFKRDRLKHASPNSAQTEAAMAGALGVQLLGDAYYFGKPVKKQTIGDPLRKIEAEDIRRADRLMFFASAASMMLLLAVRTVVIAVV